MAAEEFRLVEKFEQTFCSHWTVQLFSLSSHGTYKPGWILTFVRGCTICPCMEHSFSKSRMHAFMQPHFCRLWCSQCAGHCTICPCTELSFSKSRMRAFMQPHFCSFMMFTLCWSNCQLHQLKMFSSFWHL